MFYYLGDLCQALMCRKEERCLLENAYTAVCVSRAEIKRNGYVSTTLFTKKSITHRAMDFLSDVIAFCAAEIKWYQEVAHVQRPPLRRRLVHWTTKKMITMMTTMMMTLQTIKI